MLVPISWLKEFVSFNLTPAEIAEKFTSIGFEVEDIIYQNQKHNNVVVGKIVGFEKHPNADKLTVCKIKIGKETIQVVTNVTIQGNEIVAVALDGAVLSQNIKIKAGELRGVLSQGMLCGLNELSLTEYDVDGQKTDDIIKFKDEKLVGMNAFDALGYDDVILDISITANRGDCNSIYRLARELSVMLNKPIKELDISYKTKSGKNKIQIEVENQQLCPRYMACIVENIKVKQSPKKIVRRLRAVGLNAINNIVDLTNYVLIELGQPTHAFDYDSIESKKIVVKAMSGLNEVTALNGLEYEIEENDIAITDGEKAIAIAGIMGGNTTATTEDSKNIIFESANFARDYVRKTSKKLNLRSDSSSRFEKGIDLSLQEIALKRILHYVDKFGYGDIQAKIYDVKTNFKKEKNINFKLEQIEKILGCPVDAKKFEKIFTLLGVNIAKENDIYKLTVKEERSDLENINDIAEEYVRFVGYDNIPSTLFENAIQTMGGKDEKDKFVDKIKSVMCNMSMNEILTYSFIPSNFGEKLLLEKKNKWNDTISIMNPLSSEVSEMRSTLIYSMLSVVGFNHTHSNQDFALFEIAKIYTKNNDFIANEGLPTEELKLVVAISQEYKNIRDLGEVVYTLAKIMGISVHFEEKTYSFLHPGRSGEIIANGKKIGFIGEVHPKVLSNFEIQDRVCIFELSIDEIFKMRDAQIHLRTYSKFPVVERDLAVVLDSNITAWQIESEFNKLELEELIDFRLFDEYQGIGIEENKKSIAIHFYFQGKDKTLVDTEIDERMKKILEFLEEKFGAKLR